MSHTPSTPFNLHLLPKSYDQSVRIPTILDNHSSEVVDMALHALQSAGFQLIEWRALLYRRMKVPILVKVSNYHIFKFNSLNLYAIVR